MTLLDTINNDMKNYMKEKDSFSLGVVRMVKGAIQLESINKKKELTDEEIISVISKQIKMRKDSIVEFEKGNRQDLVDEANAEINILLSYLPQQLSEEEILQIVKESAIEAGASSIKDMGKVMALVRPKTVGKADGKLVSQIVKDYLNNK